MPASVWQISRPIIQTSGMNWASLSPPGRPSSWSAPPNARARDSPLIFSIERSPRYRVDAPDDFDKLRTTITARIKASLEKGEDLRRIGNIEQVAPVAGLTMEQLTVLAVSASAVGAPESIAALFSIQQDAERANLTKLGVALGLRGLMTKGFLQKVKDEDYNGNTYDAITVTDIGWDWIERNRSRFYLRTGEQDSSVTGTEITDDDIPF